MNEQPIATMTVRRAGEMTPQGRQAIADWLRHQADSIERDGWNYANRFSARYLTKES